MPALSARRTERRIRIALLTLLGIGVPLALVAIVLTLGAARDNARRSYGERLGRAAQAGAAAIDERLSNYIATAHTLALLDDLQPNTAITAIGDSTVADLVRRTGEAVGASVVALDMLTPGTPQLLNTHLPPGVPRSSLPPTTNPVLLELIAHLRLGQDPVVSDLFVSPVDHRYTVAVAVPVFDRSGRYGNNAVVAAVALLVDARAFNTIIPTLAVPPGSIISVTDSRNAIVAYSKDPPHNVGRVVSRLGLANIDAVDGGGLDPDNAEIGPAEYGFRHGSIAPGWRVNVFAPAETALFTAIWPLRSLLLALSLIPFLLIIALTILWRGGREVRVAYSQMRRILDNTPSAVYVNHMDVEGRAQQMFRSPRIDLILGNTHPELTGPRGDLPADLAADDAACFHEFRREVRRTGRGTINLRTSTQHGPRDLLIEEMRFQPDDEGGTTTIGCITDLTEQLAAQEQARRLERLAMLGEMSVGVAHEMTQPLAVISMASENALRTIYGANPSILSVGDKLQSIRDQSGRALKVIEQMKAFGRADTGKKKPIVIADAVDDALNMLAGRLARRDIIVSARISRELPPVRGIPVMLGQVMINLISNAIDAYAETPEITARPLTITAIRQSRQIVLQVIDAAGGIADNVVDKIFDPFFTTKDVGTGLGLSISLAIVADMGGTMTARNQGPGACIEVRLPIDAGAQMPVQRESVFLPDGPSTAVTTAS